MKEVKCPQCKQMIESVWCYNCGEEIEVYQITINFTKAEYELLHSILGHVNYDKEECETMSSLVSRLEGK